MKRLISLITLTCIFTSMIIASVPSAGAADELIINKKAKAKTGDKVKYILYLADTEEEIEGFEMNLNFDPALLQTDSEKVNFPKADNVVKNIVKGEIFLNWTNIFSKLNFSKKDEFLDIEFTVLKPGETEITKFIKEIYGDDMTYIKKFKWTYDLKINDETVISDEPPLITDDEELIKNYQGAYINYVDGMGENSPNADDHEAVTVNNSLLQNRDETIQNRVGETVTVNQYGTYYQDVTKFVDKDNQSGGFPFWIIGVAGFVVIGALVVVAIVISKKKQ
ncbi:MAG: cohesin domain-containing protein [Ruminococcus sp.]|nr:cohesin domain-containing protein [Ruminococcus sp.]